MSNGENLRSVGEVAGLLGVSVRTLHYWEERGLLQPAQRSWSSYRLYSDADIMRAQQVLVYRATGMSLEQISEALTAPVGNVEHLRRQRALLIEKKKETSKMIEALDELLEDAVSNHGKSIEDIARILGDADFPAYSEEAQQRWGQTEDWRISQERLGAMSGGDWGKIKNNMEALEARVVAAMNGGVEPGSGQAGALAEEHRELLGEFFPVSHAKHVVLARGYVSDPRFKAYYERRAPGLAVWLKQIIDANAAAHGTDPATAQWE